MWPLKLWYGVIRIVSWLIVLGFGLAALSLVLHQIGFWLKYAVWQLYSIGEALRDLGFVIPPSPALGVQKIIEYILSLPTLAGELIILACFGATTVWAQVCLEGNGLVPVSSTAQTRQRRPSSETRPYRPASWCRGPRRSCR
jgi:hypothetical protein